MPAAFCRRLTERHVVGLAGIAVCRVLATAAGLVLMKGHHHLVRIMMLMMTT
jgi:hypothetical protein